MGGNAEEGREELSAAGPGPGELRSSLCLAYLPFWGIFF